MFECSSTFSFEGTCCFCVCVFDLVRAIGSSLRRLTVRLNCIVCLREREQERCRRRGIVDQDDDKTDDDGGGLREWKGGGGRREGGDLSFLAYWHQFAVLYTKSNHVFLFFFLFLFFLAGAVVCDPLTNDETNRKKNKQQEKECSLCRGAKLASSSGIRASMYRSAVVFLVIN